MRRCLPVLACAALLWSADLRAETFEEGLRAFRAGQPERALSIWQPLAEDGHAAAQYSLGKLFEQGEGPIKQDFGRAVQWYEAAAEQDLPAAQNNLGLMFAKGRGVAGDVNRAMDLWFEAARQDYPWSQYNLGLAFFQGKGVQANQQEALAWFRRAADGGLADSQFIMGQLYREGLIVQQNRGRALTWYMRAADQGHMRAKKQMGHLQNAQVTPKATGEPEAVPTLLAENEPARSSAPENAVVTAGPAQEEIIEVAAPKNSAVKEVKQAVQAEKAPPKPVRKQVEAVPAKPAATPVKQPVAEKKPVVAKSKPQPATQPAVQDVATAQVAPVAKPASKPKAAASVSSETPRPGLAGQVAALVQPAPVLNDAKRDGAFRVWLASASSEAEAAKMWQSARSEHPDLLSATEAAFSAVDVGGGKTLYRILAGPLASSAAALRLCQQLRQARPDAFCQVRSQ